MENVDKQRRELIAKILSVPDDLDAIRKVRDEVEQWLCSHPNDLMVMGVCESLGMRESALRLQRDQVLDLIYHAKTLPEIERVEQVVLEWIREHSNDHEIRFTAELLVRTREALQE